MVPDLKESVVQAVETLITLLSSDLEKQKKQLLVGTEDDKLFITLTVKKIPFVKLGYTKLSKVPLPHSIFNPSSSLCLFVKDFSDGPDCDEKTVMHFQDLLEKNDLSGRINEIIPLHQLRTEFKPYEAKRNLCHSHDRFLADDRIAGHLYGLIGKEFWKMKKLPIKINLQGQDLTKEFNKVRNHTYFHFSGRGSLSSLHVANSSQNSNEIVENVISAMNHLCKIIPGGWDNIKRVHLKRNSSLAIPIYSSTSSANNVELPVPSKKRRVVEAEELSTKLNTKVQVYSDGHVRVLKDKDLPDGVDDGSDDEEDDLRELIVKRKRKRGFHTKKMNKRRRMKPKKQL